MIELHFPDGVLRADRGCWSIRQNVLVYDAEGELVAGPHGFDSTFDTRREGNLLRLACSDNLDAALTHVRLPTTIFEAVLDGVTSATPLAGTDEVMVCLLRRYGEGAPVQDAVPVYLEGTLVSGERWRVRVPNPFTLDFPNRSGGRRLIIGGENPVLNVDAKPEDST